MTQEQYNQLRCQMAGNIAVGLVATAGIFTDRTTIARDSLYIADEILKQAGVDYERSVGDDVG